MESRILLNLFAKMGPADLSWCLQSRRKTIGIDATKRGEASSLHTEPAKDMSRNHFPVSCFHRPAFTHITDFPSFAAEKEQSNPEDF
jgi:hypothetical protein